MTKNEKAINKVINNVSTVIRGYIRDMNDHASSGLASEGYNGGYRDALCDVLLFLRKVKPNRNCFWDDIDI